LAPWLDFSDWPACDQLVASCGLFGAQLSPEPAQGLPFDVLIGITPVDDKPKSRHRW